MIVAISVACGAASAAEPIAEDAVQVEGREADDERRGDDANDEPDLLIERRGADDVAGLQILRRVAGVGRGDADDRADAERDRASTCRRSSRAPRRGGR